MAHAERGSGSVIAPPSSYSTCASLLHPSCTDSSCCARRITAISACILLALPFTCTFSRSSVAGFLCQPLEGTPRHPPTHLNILTSEHSPTERQELLQSAVLCRPFILP
ncbi:unspecified product [Leishmania tarentolae]|uniref:Unspecified product n=1 Tax=Leishmania tarentolae TaxID=5689 RepID=A0A640KMM8_LEITA|nr:unspecified product [Leishmania tarentolae]